MPDVTPPKIIYHYTTAEGLLGILNEKALWATKIHYLNDATELVEPIRIAKKILEELSAKADKYSIECTMQRMLSDIFEWESINTCVVSFCAKGDLLSQWRAYGVSSSSYSIGFDSAKLTEAIKAHPFELKQCKYYNPNDYNKAVYQFILESSKEKDLPDNFIGRFINMAAVMKLKCFSEEEEWRIVSYSPLSFTDLRFRVGKSMLIPYYSLPITLSSIVEIIIGPCPHPNLAKDAIAGLSHKYRLDNVVEDNMVREKVKVSEIPYRNY